MSEARILTAADVDPKLLRARSVAVIGFGSQGAAHAKLLHEGGADVRVGLRPGSASAQAAKAAGIPVKGVAEAVKEADLIAVLIPDTAQARVYQQEIGPNLRKGAALLFAHGFNIHFGTIRPPANVDVIMVAPKSPGPMLYREASQGNGVPALIAVHQDATGRARDVALAYAHGLGSTRAGVLETTFVEETETDLFGEQAVLCGGLTSLILAGFETLVEAGYQPEVAYFECLHEVKLIVDLIYQGGITGMRKGVSDTAEWGDYVSGPRVVGAPSRAAMKEILAEIRSGQFARRWIEESKGDAPEFNRLRALGRAHQIETVGARLRSRMAWLSAAPKAASAGPKAAKAKGAKAGPRTAKAKPSRGRAAKAGRAKATPAKAKGAKAKGATSKGMTARRGKSKGGRSGGAKGRRARQR